MNLSKRTALIKTLVISQFHYCPLVSMFHSRKLNHRRNSIHEIALRVTYLDYQSTLLQLLQKDNSVKIHQRSLKILATEICKAKNDLSPEIMKEMFEIAHAQKESILYAEMLKLPITVFNKSNI